MVARVCKIAFYLVSFLMMLLICQAGVQQEGTRTEFLIEENKVAGIAIGDDAESVLQRYRGNARLVDLQLEGTYSPAYYIKPEGASREDAIVAELSDGKVPVIIRIMVYDSAFRTHSGIGVGSTIGQVRSHHKITSVRTAEWSCGILVEELAMGFSLDISELHKEADSWENPDDIPDNVKIQCVILTTKGKK